MSVVCEACGKSNRANAMFCSGCTRRLPGFVASGPSALASQPAPLVNRPQEHDAAPTTLDALAFRPPSHRPRGARTAGSDMPILPAEAQRFWLRVGALALALLVGFAGWYFYVTRKVDLVTPPAETPAASLPDSSVTPVAPAAQSAQSPAPAAGTTRSAVTAPADAGGGGPAPAAKTAARPAREPRNKVIVETERPSARVRPPKVEDSRTTRAPRDTREEASGDPSPAVVARSLALARGQGDAAPASPGPGPAPGPAVTAGPGPRVADDNAVRAPPRVPSLPANDLGPPIAPGPGPQYDFSTPGAARR